MAASLIPIDGSGGEGGGQIVRTAVALAALTGQGCEISQVRAGRVRPGLRPQHLAAVRAAQFACDARVFGAFDGSLELRFEPGALRPGDFRFDIATAGAACLVLQTVLLPLWRCPEESRVVVTGGTHVPASPSWEFVARPWAGLLQQAFGVELHLELVRTGFAPPGGGEVRARVVPGAPPEQVRLERRGALQAIRGISGAGRLRGEVARRQAEAARALLWEQRRLESEWVVRDTVAAASPGSYLLLEAVFENGRAAFGLLGRRGLRAEVLGERAARSLLRFLESEAAVDPHLADQLALPLALCPGGGVVTTPEVTAHLETVAGVLRDFGIPARVEGHRGAAGALLVDAH